MHWYKKLEDLPISCKALIDAVENLMVTEHLYDDNFEYKLIQHETGSYVLRIGNLPFLEIPDVVTENKPVSITLNTTDLIGIKNKDEFETKIKQLGIVIDRRDKAVKKGFFSTKDITSVTGPRWKLYFVNQDTIYDFYVLYQQHKVE